MGSRGGMYVSVTSQAKLGPYCDQGAQLAMASSNMSAMFENAVNSIIMGIEDYTLDRPDRSLSAVRNFSARMPR
jgi:hypothetical protein